MTLATVAIISIGDMGVGIARLLAAHNYHVITNVSGRSQATRDRAKRNSIDVVESDAQLCSAADYILSIVPPKDAIDTAHRIKDVTCAPSFHERRSNPLYFLDLNATSPRTAREINDILTSPMVRFLDGGIIGGPPTLADGNWKRPSIVVSGQFPLSLASPSGSNVAEVLKVKHINHTIGSATGLKMCFAALSKGFTALAIQSFTTAQNLGVLEELRSHLDEYSPGIRTKAEKGLVSMPPKAYRWIYEMEQIAETFEKDGGFEANESMFPAIAQTYKLVAYGTELGKEVSENRQAGKTADDVGRLMSEGIGRRRASSI